MLFWKNIHQSTRGFHFEEKIEPSAGHRHFFILSECYANIHQTGETVSVVILYGRGYLIGIINDEKGNFSPGWRKILVDFSSFDDYYLFIRSMRIGIIQNPISSHLAVVSPLLCPLLGRG